MPADLAFGITAARRGGQERLGAELERLGYAELWVNDTRRGDGLATLAAIAPSTRSLRLAIGVIALTEHDPARINARIEAAGLPAERLTLGVGSGDSASLRLVADGVAALRSMLPGMPIAVAAVGPRMAHLAGMVADLVVANWALPDRLAFVREQVAAGAAAARRPPPRLVAYVRTAIGRGAKTRLSAEMDRYAAYGAHYARAFQAQPERLVGVAVEVADGDQLRAEIEPYRSAVDTVVVRGIPASDDVDAWLELASLAALAPVNGG